MNDGRLHLVEGRWYGWQMLPGYAGGYEPYFSPIRILQVEPLKTGRGILRLAFWNALYAEGVQHFKLDLEIRTQRAAYLITELCRPGADDMNRSAVISKLSINWIERFCPDLIQGARTGPAAENTLEDYLKELYPG